MILFLLGHSCRGVCISDMIPFYLGKLFRQSGVSGDISSKVRSRDLSQLTHLIFNLYHARPFFCKIMHVITVVILDRNWQGESSRHITWSRKVQEPN
jgi:hypothetical protein